MTLATLGVQVIPRVLDDVECEALLDSFWRYLKDAVGIERDDPDTYKKIFELYPMDVCIKE